MESAPLLLHIGLWAMTGLVLLSAVLVVVTGNLFRAALSLGLVLVGVAGLFILLEAEFLALVQILIYVGAILALVVFAIMLTARVHSPSMRVNARQKMPAAIATLLLFFLLNLVTQRLAHSVKPADTGVGLVQLGRELITTLVLPFEVISLLFVAAMVGAIVVASSKSEVS